MEIRSACWNIDCKELLCSGTPDQVDAAVKHAIEVAKKAGDTSSAIQTLFIRESTRKTALQCLRRQKNMWTILITLQFQTRAL